MATVKASTLTYLIHRLLRHPKPKSPVCLFHRTFSVSTLTCKSDHHDERRLRSYFPSIFISLPLPSPFISLSSLLIPKSFSSLDGTELVEDEQDTDNEENDDSREEEDGFDRTMISIRRSSEISEEMMTESSPLKLSAKERKNIASYAHSLGDKLKCKIVGKSGVTDSFVLSFLETLEKDELLKVKIHRTCPGELEDTILHLEEGTGSVAVGKIGRTVILYRPSPTKLIAKRR